MKTQYTFFISAVFCLVFYESVAQTDTAYINRILWLSDSLSSKNQYKAAFTHIREAETLLRADGDTTSALFGKAILKKGIWLYKQEDYEGAFNVLRHSLVIHHALPQPKVINTAAAHQAIASVCFETGEYQLGLNHLDSALAIVIFVRKTEKHLQVASIYNNQAGFYIAMTRYKEALACHQKTLDIRKSFSQAPTYNDAVASSFYGIGTLYFRMGENGKALIYLDSSLTIRNNMVEKNQNNIHNVLNAKGACYFALGMLDSAIFLHKQVLAFRQKPETPLSDLANIYQNLANDYLEFGVLDSAIHYHQGALALRNKLFKDKKHTSIADCYHNLGICYESLGQFDFALSHFLQARDIWEPLPDKTALCLVHRKIGEVLLKQNKLDEGLEHLEQGIKKLLELEHTDTSLLFGIMGSKGDALFKVGRLNDAHQIYTEALELARHKYGANTLSEARCLAALGNIERERGNTKEAINLHRLALETHSVKLPAQNERLANNYLSLALDYAASENTVLPSVFFEKALKAVGFETSNIDLKAIISIETALECLDQKGAYHFKNYVKTGLLAELQEANNTYQDYSTVLTGLLYETNQAEALSGIIARAQPAMEAAMSIAAALSQKTADQTHLETCFQWMELSQNLTLLRSIRRSNIDFSKHVDPVLLQQEKETFQRIHRLRYKRDSLMQNNATYNEAGINRINTLLFEQQTALEHVLQQIRTSYPEYARITQRVDPVSLRAFQEKELQSNQALIVFEYAATQNRLFILYASVDTAFLLEKTPEFDVETALKELHFGIHGQQDAKRQTDELPQRAMNAFKKQGYAFFKLMFEPFADRLTNQSLLIAPHGILALLPFDALLTKDPGASQKYGSFDYLGKHHPISYAYSISLHQELKQANLAAQSGNQLVGFAPEFVSPKPANGTKSLDSPNFAPIPHSKIEVETIVQKNRGKGFYGQQATEENFIKEAPEAQIIHISTHTWWEPKTGLPCIVFQPIPDQEENEFLFPNEIYPLRLKADLVVFSACETGVGPVEAGGGVASLARAFSFAGARGLVTTLWKVDGLQSKELMTLFYEMKTPQSSYSEALWRAKNAYLEKFPQYAAPYYWAGFNHVGGN